MIRHWSWKKEFWLVPALLGFALLVALTILRRAARPEDHKRLPQPEAGAFQGETRVGAVNRAPRAGEPGNSPSPPSSPAPATTAGKPQVPAWAVGYGQEFWRQPK